ncbi:hypothetical protein Pmani_010432 [Petrolisthes manimaculis]|uniref:Uncharacterized protein n=1 Tax=Petrolisthes manimaculis TaxID=1843537 RepID=A0AAE1Q523_9EUCA|nr:hypothetical protein Pmani_010432 [Petrolisthes manimaculis]
MSIGILFLLKVKNYSSSGNTYWVLVKAVATLCLRLAGRHFGLGLDEEGDRALLLHQWLPGTAAPPSTDPSAMTSGEFLSDRLMRVVVGGSESAPVRIYLHPTADIHPIVDQLLRTVQLSPDLGMYTGQLSDYVLSRLQQLHSLRYIYLGISSNHQATLLMNLITSTSCKHLDFLSVVVTSDVLPEAITTNLPVTESWVWLYLLDVTDARMSWACEMVANFTNLSQSMGYSINFPRSTLDEAGWIRMIQDLGRRGIRNTGEMWVPDTSITSQQADQINTICSNTLGARFYRKPFNEFKK